MCTKRNVQKATREQPPLSIGKPFNFIQMKNLKTILFFIVALSFAVVLANCIDEASLDTSSDDDDGSVANYEYVDEEPVEEEHAVGDSSCPQKLDDRTVHASGKDGNLDVIDSCYATCESGSIDVYFDGDQKSQGCTFADGNSTCDLTIEFNCNQAANVSTSVECTFYKDNKEVNSASIPVKVDVK